MNPAADRPRVVFDCNILVQAISNEAGPAGQALALLQQNRIEVYVSGAVLKELRKVFQYPSVRAKFPDLDDQRIEMFIKKLTFRAKLLREVRHVFDYPRATQDEPYIDLAGAAKANYLVSRDKDRVEPPHLSGKEADLLQQINLGFSSETWDRYDSLIAKRENLTLTPPELDGLRALTEQLETQNVRRIDALVELARLRDTTLEALMDALQIKPHERRSD